ncbi:MAG: hypothetical protein U9Q06_02100 [Nanoarchaeota archaeon]|nr:hypothetical protein [Nanoarchaeota archaeon]
MIPKTRKGLKKIYKRCENKFIKIDPKLYIEYQNLAYEDFDSAKKEENPRWAATKAYQALFLMCNSILVKKAGIYSKNHNCVLIALFWKNIISENILENVQNSFLEKNKIWVSPLNNLLYNRISEIRIARNRLLYLPNSLRKITISTEKIIEDVRQLIQLLGEIE